MACTVTHFYPISGTTLTIPSTDFGAQEVGVTVTQAGSSAAVGTLRTALVAGATTTVVVTVTSGTFDLANAITVNNHKTTPVPTNSSTSSSSSSKGSGDGGGGGGGGGGGQGGNFSALLGKGSAASADTSVAFTGRRPKGKKQLTNAMQSTLRGVGSMLADLREQHAKEKLAMYAIEQAELKAGPSIGQGLGKFVGRAAGNKRRGAVDPVPAGYVEKSVEKSSYRIMHSVWCNSYA